MKRLGLLLLPALGAACAVGPVRQVRVFQAADLKTYDLRRVVVFPFRDASSPTSGDAAGSVNAAFVRELRKRSPYEVVQLPRETMVEVEASDPSERGEYRVDSLIAVGKRFNADAIVFGTLTAVRSYFPQALGLRAEMVSTETGATLWSVDALYDGGDRDVENAVRLYYEKTSSHYSDTEDWRTVLASPSRFAGFVASRCVEALWAPEPVRPVSAADWGHSSQRGMSPPR